MVATPSGERLHIAQGLDLPEVATLLMVEDDEMLVEVVAAALTVKQRIYGDRIVLFAPLTSATTASTTASTAGTGRRMPSRGGD